MRLFPSPKNRIMRGPGVVSKTYSSLRPDSYWLDICLFWYISQWPKNKMWITNLFVYFWVHFPSNHLINGKQRELSENYSFFYQILDWQLSYFISPHRMTYRNIIIFRTMAIRVVEFSRGEYKIRKIFA